MRVGVYVPEGRAAERTRRSIERQLRSQGHEVADIRITTAAEAVAAYHNGAAEIIAAREKHLIEVAQKLTPWLMAVPKPRSIPGEAPVMVVPALGLLGWLAARRRQVLVGGAVAAAGVTTAALVLLPTREPEITAIGPVEPTPSASAAITPSSDASMPASTRPARAPLSSTRRPTTPQPTASPTQPSATTTVPTSATTTPSATSTTTAAPEDCLLEVNVGLLPALPVELCVGHG